jgi:flagellar biosynthetic protein FliQ
MDQEMVMTLGREALYFTALLAAPLLLSALTVGLLIGIFQAATQIQEMTLSFIPKLMALVVALVAAGPWMLQTVVFYTRSMFERIPGLVG